MRDYLAQRTGKGRFTRKLRSREYRRMRRQLRKVGQRSNRK